MRTCFSGFWSYSNWIAWPIMSRSNPKLWCGLCICMPPSNSHAVSCARRKTKDDFHLLAFFYFFQWLKQVASNKYRKKWCWRHPHVRSAPRTRVCTSFSVFLERLMITGTSTPLVFRVVSHQQFPQRLDSICVRTSRVSECVTLQEAREKKEICILVDKFGRCSSSYTS